MSQYQDTVWCDNCGVEITWAPIQVSRKHYCCRDCRQGYRCECSQMIDLDDDRRYIDVIVEIPAAPYSR